MTILERAQAKHKDAVNLVTKLRDKRDTVLDTLIKAEGRYRQATKAVARSQKRLDKLREEERKAKALEKKAKADSKKELPDIAAIV